MDKVENKIEIMGIEGANVIPHLPWFQDVPKRKQVDSESIESIIVNMFANKYHGLLGVIDGKPIGLLIYYMRGNHHVVFKFMYIRSHMAQMYMRLMEYFNKFKISSFEFESMHKPKLWDRMFPGNIKALRTTYTFDVAALFKKNKTLKDYAKEVYGKKDAV